jgi:hypothetical protein
VAKRALSFHPEEETLNLRKLRMETLKKKKNLERLLKASEKGDVAAVRALLKRGNVDVNGGDGVRLLSALRQTAAWLLCGNESALWMWHGIMGLTVGFIAHELSV